uniref:ERCC1-like central domain-containing protein n=1 Tax=Catharus ustulatus TaxID=91951 RepID=A0A8C3UR32_CATUS
HPQVNFGLEFVPPGKFCFAIPPPRSPRSLVGVGGKVWGENGSLGVKMGIFRGVWGENGIFLGGFGGENGIFHGDVTPNPFKCPQTLIVPSMSLMSLSPSLRYHHLNPDYIHERLRALGRSFGLQVLLLQVDVRDPHQALKDLAKVCLLTDCTLLLAWSAEEAGRYLETFKSYEQKPPDLLKERVEQDFLSRVTDCLTSVKSVNKTDALSLLGTFGSLAAVAGASREDLSLCPGVGPQKAKRLFDVLHEPFLKTPR